MRHTNLVNLVGLCLLPLRNVYSLDPRMDMDMESDTMGSMGSMGAIDSNEKDNNANIIPVPYEVKHLHGIPILQNPSLTVAERLYWESYNTTTFFTTDLGDRFALRYHIVTITIILFVMYPIGLILNAVSSSWYLPILTINLGLTVSSLISLSVFVVSFPRKDWYPHNIYPITSTILLFLTIIHFVTAVFSNLSKNILLEDNSSYSPLENIALDQYNDNSTEVNEETPTSKYSTQSVSNDTDNQDIYQEDTYMLSTGDTVNIVKPICVNPPSKFFKLKFFKNPLVVTFAETFGGFCTLIFNILNYPLLIYLLTNFCIGLAIGSIFGRGIRIFNLLAHWIKGAVFLLLGTISLARYCGLGAGKGWAWNKVIYTNNQIYGSPLAKYMPRGTITMEFMEAFLIFFYGITNVFLEHLAGAGGAWTAKDLQHISIAFMYIGTGLCGLLTEIKLNSWRYYHTLVISNLSDKEVYAASPGYSPNPFPAMTIFWTGILMSQHAQASHISTQVHMQWGYLLSYGSFFRIFTFLLLYFKPIKNSIPAKPLTELISSFCLILGGFIFMESTDQVIEAMEYRGFSPIFTFNISIGLVMLFMAWVMMLCMWKEWLEKCKYERSRV